MSYYQDSFEDYGRRKIQVNWSEKLWAEHLKKHSELSNFSVASGLIRQAISNPSLVLQGARQGTKELALVYYKEISRDQDFIKYIKVVVGCSANPHYVKSVWSKEALHYLVVQEKRYPQFKEIWKDPNSYI